MAKIKIRMLKKSRAYFKKNPRIKKISKSISYYFGFIGMTGTILFLILLLV